MQLDDLAQQARTLIACDAVALVLGCPEQNLRHTLLERVEHVALSEYRVAGYDGAGDRDALLEHERIRAMCDLAVQTGQWQCLSRLDHVQPFQNVAALPIERPAGVLGLVVCGSAQEWAFCQGERLLLQQYLPVVARELERNIDHAREMPAASEERAPYDFISMVSHELRRPLTAIKGYAVLLQAYGGAGTRDARISGDNAPISPDLQRAYLDHIVEQTGHLEVLVGDLLDVSRVHAGRLALHSTPVNVALLCQRVTQLMQDQVERQSPGRYTLRCVMPPRVPLIRADPDRLQQVLTNLLDNAVKYSPGGGTIEVTASAPPLSADTNQRQTHQQMVQITVRDWGLGIPSEQQGHLFQPFSRLSLPAQQIAGAGLGLYLSRALVEAMRGTIAVTSKAGEGTDVSLMFPAFS